MKEGGERAGSPGKEFTEEGTTCISFHENIIVTNICDITAMSLNDHNKSCLFFRDILCDVICILGQLPAFRLCTERPLLHPVYQLQENVCVCVCVCLAEYFYSSSRYSLSSISQSGTGVVVLTT